MTTKVTKAVEQVLRQEQLSPGFAMSVRQQAIMRESGLPASVTNAFQQVLIVTEVPVGSRAVTVMSVLEQALIEEGLGKTTAQQVVHQTIVEEAPATPHISGVTNPTLVLIEGPIIETRLLQVPQQALVADLYRGELYTTGVGSQALLQTEVPTKDPYRAKTTTVSHATGTSFVHPSQAAAAHRLKNTYTFVGLSVSYPERAVSNIRVPSTVNQLVLKKQPIPPNTIISNVRIPAAYGAVAQKFTLPNPTTVKSKNNVSQTLKGIAQKTSFTNPTTVISIRHTQQITVSQGHAASFKSLSQIQSDTQVSTLYAAYASPTVYQIPPQSDTNVNALKTEIAAPKLTFLNPLDPRLASQIHWNAIKAESASATTLADPVGIFSTEMATSVNASVCAVADYIGPDMLRSTRIISAFNTGTAALATFGNPDGITPGGREYQIAMQHVYGSQFYQFLPISSEKTQRVMIQTASHHTFRNPIFVAPTAHTHQSKVEVAVVAVYGDPRAVKPKRRISSSSIVGVTP